MILQDLTPLDQIGKACQVNNSVSLNGKPIESEKFLNQVVEAIGIIINRRPKGRSCEMER